ncbi:MAG: nucleotidyltransferase domain-containing protein [Thermoproteota archaeon]
MFEQYVKLGRETLEYLEKYREVAASVKDIVKEDYKDAKVYVFGSVVSGRYTASSDIDVLIVSNEAVKEGAASLKARILQRMGPSVPVEIHVATQREFVGWYLRFIDGLVEI